MTQSVPELVWSGNNKALIQYAHTELGEAFGYIKVYLGQGERKLFLNHIGEHIFGRVVGTFVKTCRCFC